MLFSKCCIHYKSLETCKDIKSEILRDSHQVESMSWMQAITLKTYLAVSLCSSYFEEYLNHGHGTQVDNLPSPWHYVNPWPMSGKLSPIKTCHVIIPPSIWPLILRLTSMPFLPPYISHTVTRVIFLKRKSACVLPYLKPLKGPHFSHNKNSNHSAGLQCLSWSGPYLPFIWHYSSRKPTRH